MIAKVTTRGDLEDASYLSTWTPYSSKCYALALVPEVDNVVAVGDIYDGYKTSALVMSTTDTLSKISIVAWANRYSNYAWWVSQSAKDVTVAPGDGSIYVVGVLT